MVKLLLNLVKADPEFIWGENNISVQGDLSFFSNHIYADYEYDYENTRN